MPFMIRDRTVSGDFKAIIHTGQNPGFGKYVQLRYGNRACGAIAEFIPSDKESVHVDKFLRLFLGARNNDWIDVHECQPRNAESIEILKAENWEPDEKEIADIRTNMLDKPVCNDYIFPKYYWNGGERRIRIGKTNPAGVVICQPDTNIIIVEKDIIPPDFITWDDIGGLYREKKRIRHLIEYPLRHQQTYGYFGVDAPRGILLYGPPGTGKTRIAQALKTEAKASIFIIQGPEIIGSHFGESEKRLREIFEQAHNCAPAIILIDEIDALVPKRDLLRSEVFHGVVATMLTLLDGLRDMQGVIVIGTTNRPGEIDQALRRPGRLEEEIMIPAPDKAARKEIFNIHTRNMPLAERKNGEISESLLESLGEATAGYTGADIAALCREAGRCALLRYFSEEELESGQLYFNSSMNVAGQDFFEAMKNVQPTAMRGTVVEVVRDITLDMIGGLSDIKEELIDNITYGLADDTPPGLKPAKGILLHGPSGTGKTTLVRALANHFQANLITLRGPELHRKWFGESEETVRSMFAKAREVAPCILLLDEVDSIAPIRGQDASGLRESITSQVLSELEKIQSAEKVFVIATTNQPKNVDPALRRPGRLDMEIAFPEPDDKAREEVFAIHLKDVKLASDLNLSVLAARTKKFSGADIAECCRRSKFRALKEAGRKLEKAVITMDQLLKDIEKIRQVSKSRPKNVGFLLPHEKEGMA